MTIVGGSEPTSMANNYQPAWPAPKNAMVVIPCGRSYFFYRRLSNLRNGGEGSLDLDLLQILGRFVAGTYGVFPRDPRSLHQDRTALGCSAWPTEF